MAEEEKNEIEEPEASVESEGDAEGVGARPASPEPAEPAEPAEEEPAPVAEKPKPAPKKAAPKKPTAEAKPGGARPASPGSKARAAAKRPAERKAVVRLPKPERERGKQKERRGVVVSSAMEKTIVVRVDTVRPHPAYKKVVKRSQKFHAHDEQNAANVGDVVRIVETRPLSKTKSWRLAEVLEVAK
jgi:small subunit ribosomal protein S17